MTLEEAATKVQISKKSLDDYLMQLRSAKKYGFDFDKHIREKVGVIRSFVRQMKQEEKAKKELAASATKVESVVAEEIVGASSRTAVTTARKSRKREFKPQCKATATELFTSARK